MCHPECAFYVFPELSLVEEKSQHKYDQYKLYYKTDLTDMRWFNSWMYSFSSAATKFAAGDGKLCVMGELLQHSGTLQMCFPRCTKEESRLLFQIMTFGMLRM